MATKKLAEADVLRVLELRAQKLTQAAIAKEFNVSTPTISFILTGRTWGHVTGIVFKPRNRKRVESPKPKPKPPPQRDPNKQYCEKCGKVMSVKNTSNARYTVFVLWKCVCGFEYLEHRTTKRLLDRVDPDLFEDRSR